MDKTLSLLMQRWSQDLSEAASAVCGCKDLDGAVYELIRNVIDDIDNLTEVVD